MGKFTLVISRLTQIHIGQTHAVRFTHTGCGALHCIRCERTFGEFSCPTTCGRNTYSRNADVYPLQHLSGQNVSTFLHVFFLGELSFLLWIIVMPFSHQKAVSVFGYCREKNENKVRSEADEKLQLLTAGHKTKVLLHVFVVLCSHYRNSCFLVFTSSEVLWRVCCLF